MAKRGRKPRLNDALIGKIVSYIRAGAYDWVAAQACGVPSGTFYRWLQQGESANAGIYREFREQVLVARAEARTAAEIEVRRDDPKFWLRVGPGRERPGEPGWTEAAKVELSGKDGAPLTIAVARQILEEAEDGKNCGERKPD
jgi:hypothetical protein